MQIVLALKSKIKAPTTAGSDAESREWRAHLRAIKQTISNGEYPMLTNEDWVEIYYSLDDADTDADLQEKIGPDGMNMTGGAA